MINPDAVVAAARAAMNTPFVAQGRSPAEGLDCTGLVLYSFLQAGWEPLQPDITNDRHYSVRSDGKRLLRVMRAECVQVAMDTLKPADIVLIRWKPDGVPMHCSLVTQAAPLQIIHTSVETMKVSERSVDAAWQWHLHSAWRCRALC